MTTTARWFTASLLGPILFLGASSGAWAAPPPAPAIPAADAPIGRTPPRLSYVDGEVSFWRPGASNWAPAQVNTPLAAGDETYTGNRGNLELQIGARAFVRAWGDTQLGFVNQEPDFLQFRVTAGHVSLDLRGVEPGRTVEIDTPMAAFTVDAPGYYRVDVSPERTAFITRRSGRATMTVAGGSAVAIAPSEEVVLDGATTPRVQSFVAPPLDVWDSWNYARTDELIDSMSARYVPAGVYGVDDLDHYGAWRVVPTYGAVWVPREVATGWAPYSTGRWVADPQYGWTWVDAAPWGWAPYHYGRWVYVDGYWAWAPGPLVARPVYAPALVAFFGAPGVRVVVGSPFVSWVALGWGEPLVPWWGSARFVDRPSWAGWGGPRVVNNVVVNRTTVVNVQNITVYNNTTVRNAVVAVREDAFGRRAVHEARVADVDVRRLEPVHGRLRVTPDASSFVAASGPAVTPPPQTLQRRVVATRRPAAAVARPDAPRERMAPAVSVPAPQIVPAPKPATATTPTPPRAPFGASQVERQRPSPPPRFETPRADTRPERTEPRAEPRVERPDARAPRSESRPETPRDAVRPPEASPAPRALPGEPANRVSPWRREGGERHSGTPAPTARATTPGRGAPSAVVERGDARRTSPKPAADHADRDERPARGRTDR
ncbi:MAG: hypothetical protein DMD80_25645 [Candidatus Rokuibacteriota bacterium]|nr:MAG: hypothetical protein DMD80_25645 [Candidatus Rokubacteria bacterium]